MRKFGEYIRDARLSRGLTIEDLSEKAKVSPSLLSMIENGKRGVPRVTTLRRLAAALGLEFQELISVAEKARKEKPSTPENNAIQHEMNVQQLSRPGDFKYTFVLRDIKAGQPIFSKSHITGQRPVLLDDIWADQAFYFEVTDESMVDEGIKKGNYVLIRPTSEFNNGDIILAVAPGDKRAMLRRIFFYPSSNVIVLQSASSKFPPKVIPMDKFDVLVSRYGVAVRVEYDLTNTPNSRGERGDAFEPRVETDLPPT